MPVLEDALKDTSAEEAELEAYISALAGRRREMEEDLQTYLASPPDRIRKRAGRRQGQPTGPQG